MRYGSVCSGIEAATVAWRHLGWECAFVSEIDAFASAVLMSVSRQFRTSATSRRSVQGTTEAISIFWWAELPAKRSARPD